MVVDTPEALTSLVDLIMDQPRAAVDTEANSLYAYQEQVCLVQLSIPGTDYLVDPLALEDMSPLAPFFESPAIEKIFHAADYDLMVLRRDFDFVTRDIFDTMWAARILGWPKVGLADILALHFDVEVNKRYQRYNWGKRPLDPQALRYAWMDSHYLLPLREIQKAELEATGRWAEAQEVFNYLTSTVDVPPQDDVARYFWRLKGVHRMRSYERKKLFQLFLWRERAAEELDRPSAMIISNNRLVRLARMQPRNREELAAAGLTPGHVRRFGTGILKALWSEDLPEPPPPPRDRRLPDDVVDRFKTLKAWRKDVARGRGVDSDVILPNATLWEIAKNPPDDLHSLLDVPGIGPWRQATYGPDLLQLVSD
ncbi:MAG: ribonuclease D [Anaerolineae bacterium]